MKILGNVTDPKHATNKEYVDDLILGVQETLETKIDNIGTDIEEMKVDINNIETQLGDVNLALNTIIEIQESYIQA